NSATVPSPAPSRPAKSSPRFIAAWASIPIANCPDRRIAPSRWSISGCRRFGNCFDLAALSMSSIFSNHGVVPAGSFTRRLREISMFFDKRDAVHESLRRLVRRLRNAKISYALMGGMAVNAHKYQRTTADVDVLLTPEAFQAFKRLHVPKNYEPLPGRSRRFVDKKNKVQLDFLLTGLFPGSGKPGPIAFPDPEDVSETIEKMQVIDLPTLVQLK